MTAKPGYELNNYDLHGLCPTAVFEDDRWWAFTEEIHERWEKVSVALDLTQELPRAICPICGPLEIINPHEGKGTTYCSPSKHAAYYNQFPVPRTQSEAWAGKESQ